MSENIYTLRAGRQMDRARIAQAQADATERQASASIAQAQAEADVAAIRRHAERDAKADRASDRRDRWTSRVETAREVSGLILERRDLLLVVLVMLASVGTAIPAQVRYYLHMGMPAWLAGLITAMSEGAAWAGAAMASKAIEDGNRPTGLYRAITWGSAGIAASLNFAHNVGRSPALACVLALASVAGVGLWEAYAHSKAQHRSGRSGEQIRRDLYRRLRFRTVHRRARDLVAAVPGMTEDGAWVIAWRAVHGADPGVTRRTLKRHRKAVAKVAAILEKTAAADDAGTDRTASVGVLQTPGVSLADIAPGGSVGDTTTAVRDALDTAAESAAPVAAILDTAPAADDAPTPEAEESPETTRTVQEERRMPSASARPVRRMSAPARAVVSRTAKESRTDDAQRLREAARAAYAASLHAGAPLGPTELGRMHGGRTEGWGRAQIRYVTQHLDEYPALAVVEGAS